MEATRKIASLRSGVSRSGCCRPNETDPSIETPVPEINATEFKTPVRQNSDARSCAAAQRPACRVTRGESTPCFMEILFKAEAAIVRWPQQLGGGSRD
jgi:hypothetical protein